MYILKSFFCFQNTHFTLHTLGITSSETCLDWKGLPAMARRVCWDLTGTKGVYRYGGNGGQFDIAHVEVNEKSTRIWKCHPLLERLEQCAARYCFGQSQTHNIIL